MTDSRRWGSSYGWVRRFLVQRQLSKGMDGKTCEICNRREDTYGRTDLIVEHIDNDPKNCDSDNLRLAHQSCNVIKDPPHSRERRLARDVFPTSVCVNKLNPVPVVRSSDGFAANANRESEPTFRRWVFSVVKVNRDYPKNRDWLVDNGSAFVGRNPVTVDRYLDKMFAGFFGMLSEDPTDTGPVVVFREPDNYDLTVEELEQKYPWEGLVRSERYFPLRKSVDMVQNPSASDGGDRA